MCIYGYMFFLNIIANSVYNTVCQIVLNYKKKNATLKFRPIGDTKSINIF